MSPTATNTDSIQARRELAHRRAGDLDVRLMWSPADDSVTVEIHDRGLQTRFVVDVDGRPALEVFNHPFAYAQPAEVVPELAA
jgi:hypothetical protein